MIPKQLRPNECMNCGGNLTVKEFPGRILVISCIQCAREMTREEAIERLGGPDGADFGDDAA